MDIPVVPQRTVDVPVVAPRQDLAFRGVQKTALAPRAQSIDGAVDVLVVKQVSDSANCSDNDGDRRGSTVRRQDRGCSRDDANSINHELDARARH